MKRERDEAAIKKLLVSLHNEREWQERFAAVTWALSSDKGPLDALYTDHKGLPHLLRKGEALYTNFEKSAVALLKFLRGVPDPGASSDEPNVTKVTNVMPMIFHGQDAIIARLDSLLKDMHTDYWPAGHKAKRGRPETLKPKSIEDQLVALGMGRREARRALKR